VDGRFKVSKTPDVWPLPNDIFYRLLTECSARADAAPSRLQTPVLSCGQATSIGACAKQAISKMSAFDVIAAHLPSHLSSTVPEQAMIVGQSTIVANLAAGLTKR
jgi:hypothetical protein